MELTTLKGYVELCKQWYIHKYGCVDWHWYDEGLYHTIADYVSMMGEFTDADVEFLHRTEFEPEDFLEDIEEDD